MPYPEPLHFYSTFVPHFYFRYRTLVHLTFISAFTSTYHTLTHLTSIYHFDPTSLPHTNLWLNSICFNTQGHFTSIHIPHPQPPHSFSIPSLTSLPRITLWITSLSFSPFKLFLEIGNCLKNMRLAVPAYKCRQILQLIHMTFYSK